MLLELHNLGFVLGTESKLDPGIPTYSIFPPSYTVFRKDRNAHGGGVFHAIKSDLACIEEDGFNENSCEILWSSIKMSNCRTLYLSLFYRPPNSPIEILDQLGDSINQVFIKVSNHPNIIIGGDFNLGDIDWNHEVPNANNPATASQHNKFLQLMADFSLTQHIKTAMRPASEKILDLLLCTYPNSISHVSSSTGLSDHLIVNFKINLKATRFSKPPHNYSLFVQESKLCWPKWIYS